MSDTAKDTTPTPVNYIHPAWLNNDVRIFAMQNKGLGTLQEISAKALEIGLEVLKKEKEEKK